MANDIDWVDDVALGFAHLLAVFVEHHAVHIDFLEWNVVFDEETHHDHAADPLEEEVCTGLHD